MDKKKNQTKYLIGKELRAIRKQQRLTQTELAQISGISQGHISLIERSEQNVSLSTAGTLSVALNVKLKQLIKE